jgi:hypothetical protein
MDTKPSTDAERCQLAREVFNTCFNNTEAFRENHFGSDLSYLIGAIVDDVNSFVDWTECQTILAKFREWFPPEHKVWLYIVEGEY